MVNIHGTEGRGHQGIKALTVRDLYESHVLTCDAQRASDCPASLSEQLTPPPPIAGAGKNGRPHRHAPSLPSSLRDLGDVVLGDKHPEDGAGQLPLALHDCYCILAADVGYEEAVGRPQHRKEGLTNKPGALLMGVAYIPDVFIPGPVVVRVAWLVAPLDHDAARREPPAGLVRWKAAQGAWTTGTIVRAAGGEPHPFLQLRIVRGFRHTPAALCLLQDVSAAICSDTHAVATRWARAQVKPLSMLPMSCRRRPAAYRHRGRRAVKAAVRVHNDLGSRYGRKEGGSWAKGERSSSQDFARTAHPLPPPASGVLPQWRVSRRRRGAGTRQIPISILTIVSTNQNCMNRYRKLLGTYFRYYFTLSKLVITRLNKESITSLMANLQSFNVLAAMEASQLPDGIAITRQAFPRGQPSGRTQRFSCCERERGCILRGVMIRGELCHALEGSPISKTVHIMKTTCAHDIQC